MASDFYSRHLHYHTSPPSSLPTVPLPPPLRRHLPNTISLLPPHTAISAPTHVDHHLNNHFHQQLNLYRPHNAPLYTSSCHGELLCIPARRARRDTAPCPEPFMRVRGPAVPENPIWFLGSLLKIMATCVPVVLMSATILRVDVARCTDLLGKKNLCVLHGSLQRRTVNFSVFVSGRSGSSLRSRARQDLEDNPELQ